MKLLRLLPFLAVVVAQAQTTAYFRASGPAGYVIVGASNTTPLVVQTLGAHNLQVGDVVVNWGVGASLGSCVSSTANGTRKVKAVIDATHFSITDLSGVDVAANGAWCDGSLPGIPAAGSAGGKLTQFTLTDQPRAWLDGPTGTTTRKLALGTANGLTSLVVSSNVATVTTSYAHGLTTGDKVGVWGSSTSALNNSGNGYTVTVTSTTTFTFPTSGVANGTYTGVNNTCGASGTADCLRISQYAYAGSQWWDLVRTTTNAWSGTSNYKHKFDGGTLGVGGQPYNEVMKLASAAVRSIVDPSDTTMRAAAKYCITNAEKFAGVNWTVYEAAGNAGNVDLNDFASYYAYPLAVCYIAARDYLTSGEKQTFADKIYNDIDWLNASPADTSKNFPRRKTLASDVAQDGSSTTITLSATDAAAANYYVNNIVSVTIGGSTSYGLVTAYDSSTKIATVASWSAGAPTAGTPYSIYATITVSATAAGAATITGYNTAFTTDLSAGDAVLGSNNWTTLVEESQSYVSSITSDAALSVINSQAVSASTTTPRVLWILPRWTAGAPGLRFAMQHWEGAMGSMASLYPSNGGDQTAEPTQGSTKYPAFAGNNLYTRAGAWLALDFALADDDPRAVQDLAVISSCWWDWQMRMYWWYTAGPGRNGSYYSTARDNQDTTRSMWVVKNSIIGLPDLDLSGPWTRNAAMFDTYNMLPDRRYSLGSAQNVPWQHNYGAETGDTEWGQQSLLLTSGLQSAALVFQPTATTTQYYVSFLKSFCCAWGKGDGVQAAFGTLMVDPRAGSPSAPADYSTQPTQRLFNTTSASTACNATGWSCPTTFQGSAIVSHTGWTSRSATHILFGVRGYYNGHDIPEAGTLRVYRVGHLLGTDQPYTGSGSAPQPGVAASGYHNAETNDSMPLFGGTSHLHGGYSGDGLRGEASILRWASVNHGSWDASYGDASSRYMYALADLSQMYDSGANLTRAHRHVAHLKKSGTEEIIVQYDDIAVSTPESIEWHQHYPQTGESTSDSAATASWPEGTTTCPGVGGCASLNTTRTILTQEDGSTDAHNPARTNGLISQYFSPGTIAVRWDGTAYAGTWGHADRVSICGGSSCGSSATALESVAVHKVAASLSDTTLTAAALNPDSNWTGVQTTDKVALFARGGALKTALNVTTTHSGTASYLVAGLAAGGYDVTMGGLPIAGSPMLVNSGDNTLYFESTSGALSIAPTSSVPTIATSSLPNGSRYTAYSQTLAATGGIQPYIWTLTAGTLPPGLTLSSAGGITGTPTDYGTYSFTAQVADQTTATDAKPLSITIANVSTSGNSLSGKVAVGGNVQVK